MNSWRSRGYLPHFDGGEILQFITLHLGDALPFEALAKWKKQLSGEAPKEARKVLFWRVEKYVDRGFGQCWLTRPAIAGIVQNALLHLGNEKYRLIAWVIMPNHIHFLIRPAENHKLEKIIHSLKSFTAQQANKLLNRRGKFWQEEYFDRYIRNYEHFEKTINYIEMNPVKAGLCAKPADWKFSSAYFYNS